MRERSKCPMRIKLVRASSFWPFWSGTWCTWFSLFSQSIFIMAHISHHGDLTVMWSVTWTAFPNEVHVCVENNPLAFFVMVRGGQGEGTASWLRGFCDTVLKLKRDLILAALYWRLNIREYLTSNAKCWAQSSVSVVGYDKLWQPGRSKWKAQKLVSFLPLKFCVAHDRPDKFLPHLFAVLLKSCDPLSIPSVRWTYIEPRDTGTVQVYFWEPERRPRQSTGT